MATNMNTNPGLEQWIRQNWASTGWDNKGTNVAGEAAGWLQNLGITDPSKLGYNKVTKSWADWNDWSPDKTYDVWQGSGEGGSAATLGGNDYLDFLRSQGTAVDPNAMSTRYQLTYDGRDPFGYVGRLGTGDVQQYIGDPGKGGTPYSVGYSSAGKGGNYLDAGVMSDGKFYPITDPGAYDALQSGKATFALNPNWESSSDAKSARNIAKGVAMVAGAAFGLPALFGPGGLLAGGALAAPGAAAGLTGMEGLAAASFPEAFGLGAAGATGAGGLTAAGLESLVGAPELGLAAQTGGGGLGNTLSQLGSSMLPNITSGSPSLGGAVKDIWGLAKTGLGAYNTYNQLSNIFSGESGGMPTGGNNPTSGNPYNWSNLFTDIGGMINSSKYGNDLSSLKQGLEGLYKPDSPYAKQLEKTLQRKDAMSGRRSDYGTRAVELQAKLADSAARMAPTLQGIFDLQNKNRNSMVGTGTRALGNTIGDILNRVSGGNLSLDKIIGMIGGSNSGSLPSIGDAWNDPSTYTPPGLDYYTGGANPDWDVGGNPFEVGVPEANLPGSQFYNPGTDFGDFNWLGDWGG